MPAGLPGSTSVQNLANPSLGNFVIFDLLSGPKGSPKDRDVQVPYLGDPAGSGFAASGNTSTGGLSTGIGFGSPPIIGVTAPASILAAGFNDDYTPGATKPDGTATTDATYMYIGGGKSLATGVSSPYTAGYGIGGFCPAKTTFFLNTKYIFLRPHSQRDMVSLDPNKRYAINQDAEVSILAWAGNLTCSGRQFQGRLVGG